MDIWNTLVKIRDKAENLLKKDPNNESLKDIVYISGMHLRQINTAGNEPAKRSAEKWVSTLAVNNFLFYEHKK